MRVVVRAVMASGVLAAFFVGCGKATSGTCEEANDCAPTLSEASAEGGQEDAPAAEDGGEDSGSEDSTVPEDAQVPGDDASDAALGPPDVVYSYPDVAVDVEVPDGCATEQPAANAVFVAPGGNTSSTCGSMTATCSTIQAGIAVAQANGRTDVYVATSTSPYSESVTVPSTFTNAVAIHGGWQDVGGVWTRVCTGAAPTLTQIQAPSVPSAASSVTVTVQSGVAVTFDTLSIYSIDEPGYGESVYGIMASPGASLTLSNVIIVVAGAGPGTPGSSGTPGTPASNACGSTGNAAPGSTGSIGAAGAHGSYSATGYSLGASGEQGGGGTGGANGGAGAAGGGSISCTTCMISVCCTPPNCQDPMMHPDTECCNPGTNAVSTAGSGMPGCGGNPGGGGNGGGGGGAAIGVYAWGAKVVLDETVVSVGPGGTGGAGGGGGAGSPGVQGANGKSVSCSNRGCSGTGSSTCGAVSGGASAAGGSGGAAGGTGGSGGQGGGGAGGDSYGYYVAVVGDAGTVTVNGGTITAASVTADGGPPNGPSGHAGAHN